jgi:tRNA pseudouridine38-40 synthase
VRNLALLIEYDGTEFKGWQRQPKARTVAGTIESKLLPLVGHEVRLIGAGRTDSGVHAMGQVANFLTGSSRSEKDLRRAVNATLPPDITVRALNEVPDEFHARYGAVSRRYRYALSLRRRSVGRAHCWEVTSSLATERMEVAAQTILGTHDFGSFCASPGEDNSMTCTVLRSVWSSSPGFLLYEIEADRFLHRMVRSLVGSMVEVGRRRMDAEQFSALLQERARDRAGPTAPAQGLTLLSVRYPTPAFPEEEKGADNETVS